MRRRLLFLGGLVLAMGASALDACWYDVPDVVGPDALAPEAGDAGGSDTGAADAAIVDANDGGCNPTASFGTPQPLFGFALAINDERYPRLSPDELTLYYAVGPAGGADEVYMATRASLNDNFTAPGTVIPGIGVGNNLDENIAVSDDGLLALLATLRPSANVIPGATQIFFASRSSTAAAFSNPAWSGSTWGTRCGDLEPNFGQGGHFFSTYIPLQTAPSTCTTNLQLHDGFFANGYLDGGWLDFSLINTADNEFSPVVTADELTLYFASNRGIDGGAAGPVRIWASQRTTSQWSPPWPVAELLTLPPGLGNPRPGWISQNGCRLYMTVHDTGSNSDDIYVATRSK